MVKFRRCPRFWRVFDLWMIKGQGATMLVNLVLLQVEMSGLGEVPAL